MLTDRSTSKSSNESSSLPRQSISSSRVSSATSWNSDSSKTGSSFPATIELQNNGPDSKKLKLDVLLWFGDLLFASVALLIKVFLLRMQIRSTDAALGLLRNFENMNHTQCCSALWQFRISKNSEGHFQFLKVKGVRCKLNSPRFFSTRLLYVWELPSN